MSGDATCSEAQALGGKQVNSHSFRVARPQTPGKIERSHTGLIRLYAMQGSDPGFFALATHSWMEAYLRGLYDAPTEYQDENFFSLMSRFLREHEENRRPPRERVVLHEILRFQTPVNKVRHGFWPLSKDEAVSALYRLIEFCEIAGLKADDEIGKLKESVAAAWNVREHKTVLVDELARLNAELRRTTSDAEALRAELQESRPLRLELDDFRRKLSDTENELALALRSAEREKSAREAKNSRVDELRHKTAELSSTIRDQEAKIASLERAESYRDAMLRLIAYTRSRRDFERSMKNLSAEQQAAVDSLGRDGDFLVRGGAGTGKTVVLLKCLEKLIRSEKARLDFDEKKSTFVLLTYTKTLVNYNRWLGSLFELGDRASIKTVDSFLRERFLELEPGKSIEFDPAKLPVPLPGSGDAAGTRNEIEGHLQTHGLDWDQSDPKRREIQEQFHAYDAWMRQSPRCSAPWAYARLREARTEIREEAKVDYLFVDEVQDLSPVVLSVLKAYARRGIIMAGDGDQAIFRKDFSFRDVGIDVVGKSRILHTNFRNTVPIHELAERFRLLCRKLETDTAGTVRIDMPVEGDTRPTGYRFGPIPELVKYGDAAAAGLAIAERCAVFVSDLDYAPENVAVVVRKRESLDLVRNALAAAGIPATLGLRDENFDFSAETGVRVLTLHSAKGLDFPVVLFLAEACNNPTNANEIYVALTRAMEQLCVFVPEKTSSRTLGALVGAFEDCGREWEVGE